MWYSTDANGGEDFKHGSQDYSCMKGKWRLQKATKDWASEAGCFIVGDGSHGKVGTPGPALSSSETPKGTALQAPPPRPATKKTKKKAISSAIPKGSAPAASTNLTFERVKITDPPKFAVVQYRPPPQFAAVHLVSHEKPILWTPN